MGGIQGREGSLAEVHAVRGGQLILRVAPKAAGSSFKVSGSGGAFNRTGSFKASGTSSCSTPGGAGPSTSSAAAGASGASASGGPPAVASSASSSPRRHHGHQSSSVLSRQSSRLSFIVGPFSDGSECSRCYILEQSMDVLEKVFIRLTPRELALLALTCRAMNYIVGQYLKHYTASFGLKEKLRRFYEENGPVLLPKEVVLKDRLDANSRHELLLYSAMRQFVGTVRRASCCDLDSFSFLPTPDCLVKERDVALKRDVVVLKSVHRLHFRHMFRSVPPGWWVIGLRMRLSNARWEAPPPQPGRPPPSPAVVTVRSRAKYSQGGKKVELARQEIHPPWWSDLETQIVRETYNCHLISPDLDAAHLTFDRDSDWFFLRLNPIRVEDHDGQDLEFEFCDCSNVCRKRGVIFDFVELREHAVSVRVNMRHCVPDP